MCHRIEQGAQDASPRDLELAPELGFGAAVLIGDRRQV
jgi:hypothetical protein